MSGTRNSERMFRFCACRSHRREVRPRCTVVAMRWLWDSRAKSISCNKRTMDRANGAFLAVVALPRINNLLAVNAVDRSTPAASTTIYIVINNLQNYTCNARTTLAHRWSKFERLHQRETRLWTVVETALPRGSSSEGDRPLLLFRLSLNGSRHNQGRSSFRP